jgi:nicotinate-nucleotide pyrophosphorylase (carboxylating)
VKAEATFIAKEDGVIAGISLAEMIFKQVDPSLKVFLSHRLPAFSVLEDVVLLVSYVILTMPDVPYWTNFQVEWFEDDGNYVHKGLQFGKVYGNMPCKCHIWQLITF